MTTAYDHFNESHEKIPESQLAAIMSSYQTWLKNRSHSKELLETFINESFHRYLNKYDVNKKNKQDECTEAVFNAFITYTTTPVNADHDNIYKPMIHYFLHSLFEKTTTPSPNILNALSEDLHRQIFKTIKITDKSLMAIEREVAQYITDNQKKIQQRVSISIDEEALDSLSKELVQTKATVRELEEAVQRKSDKISQLQKKQRGQLKELEGSHNELYSALEKQHVQQTAQSKKLQGELTQIKAARSAERLAHANEMATLEKELANLKKYNSELVKRMQVLEKDKEALNETIIMTNQQKAEMEKSLEGLKATIQAFSSFKEETLNTISEQEKSLHDRESTIDELSNQITTLTGENELLRFTLAQQKSHGDDVLREDGVFLVEERMELESESPYPRPAAEAESPEQTSEESHALAEAREQLRLATQELEKLRLLRQPPTSNSSSTSALPSEPNQKQTEQLINLIRSIISSYKGSVEKKEVLLHLLLVVNELYNKKEKNLTKKEIQDAFQLLTNVTLQKQADYSLALFHRNTTTSGELLRTLINKPEYQALKELIATPDGAQRFTGTLNYKHLRGIASKGINETVRDNNAFKAHNSSHVAAKFTHAKKQIDELGGVKHGGDEPGKGNKLQ